MEEETHERPFEGGSQPVTEHPAEVPTAGRSVMQTAVVIIAILAIVAAVLWLFVPLAS